MSAEPIRYWFHIEKGEDSCYYHRLGAVEEIEPSFAFQITPGFHTPDWAKGAVMYQIFVDRFYNGDTTNDVQDCEYIYIGAPHSGVVQISVSYGCGTFLWRGFARRLGQA